MIFGTSFLFKTTTHLFEVIEESCKTSTKLARLFVFHVALYTLFQKTISPFVSLYIDFKLIKNINRDLRCIEEYEDPLRCIVAKRMRNISVIKNIGRILILPLYTLVCTIIVVVELLINPLAAARRNVPSYTEFLEERSIFERTVAGHFQDKDWLNCRPFYY